MGRALLHQPRPGHNFPPKPLEMGSSPPAFSEGFLSVVLSHVVLPIPGTLSLLQGWGTCHRSVTLSSSSTANYTRGMQCALGRKSELGACTFLSALRLHGDNNPLLLSLQNKALGSLESLILLEQLLNQFNGLKSAASHYSQ